MVDFGNKFASRFDDKVFNGLGDTVEVVHPTLGTHSIQVELVRYRDADELADRIDDYFPSMIIMDKHYYLFENHEAVVNYNGESYHVHSDEPYKKLNHRIIFKDER